MNVFLLFAFTLVSTHGLGFLYRCSVKMNAREIDAVQFIFHIATFGVIETAAMSGILAAWAGKF